jgi:SAM-dependent methyltransferase
MESNQTFCIEWALRHGRGLRVLDFGCGNGQVVSGLIDRGVDAFGCDVYYEGGDTSSGVPEQLFSRGVVRRMEPRSIPFEDGSFDLIINNTVLEHVESLEATLAELARVLRPGGKILSLFPHREVWFEWHVGLPFVHWFSPDSDFRLKYTVLLRSIGLGFFKSTKPIVTWSRDALDWIDRWTHYRSRAEIDLAFARHFARFSRLEARWIEHKLGQPALVRHLPNWSKQAAVSLLGGLVFECEKPCASVPVAQAESRPGCVHVDAGGLA